jgi:excisionase family DNA binding protein
MFAPDGLLTVREVAEAMRVSTMTVYRLIKAEELPAIRVGKHFRIRRRDLTGYLDARVVGHPSVEVPRPDDSQAGGN